MRESMAQLTPQFSANRTVREYTEQHYIPRLRPTASVRLIRALWRAVGELAACYEQHWSNLRSAK